MSLPRILVRDGAWGFAWARPDGAPAWLADLVREPDAEADRWLPTHLESLDDQLIELAGRYGEVLGGGRGPTPGEHEDLGAAYVAIDRASLEYAEAVAAAGTPTDPRGGQILGTAALMSIRARASLGLIGPAPFDGDLDEPRLGVVGGRAGLHAVSETERWRGSRWLVVADDGRRLPATLSMLKMGVSALPTALQACRSPQIRITPGCSMS